MYTHPSFVDMGLGEGERWQSDTHRVIACRIALGNPNVTTRDKLTEVCRAVNSVPETRISSITYGQLLNEFGLPDVGIYTVEVR